MSVWSSVTPIHSPALHGSEGELVSVSVTVEPRDLEDLLEALAALDFPINPQIYHDAAVVYVDGGGGRRQEPATIVEFPAYAGGLANIRAVLEASGFGSQAVSVSPMLAEIHATDRTEPAPPGAGYAFRVLRKQAAVGTADAH
ncbi:MAG TPA: hypothetical protein VNH18_34645 [Bryobacteraceae bacterium]|nr:hypothetical protein [Bryobacteraceae bacterium]HXJ44478.1 hypothetical protein [Bryobacteraceae bacterium]